MAMPLMNSSNALHRGAGAGGWGGWWVRGGGGGEGGGWGRPRGPRRGGGWGAGRGRRGVGIWAGGRVGGGGGGRRHAHKAVVVGVEELERPLQEARALPAAEAHRRLEFAAGRNTGGWRCDASVPPHVSQR